MPETLKLIGFAGTAGAGKDTAAGALIPLGFLRRAFADPIKCMLEALMRIRGATWLECQDALWGAGKETPNKFLSGRTPRFAAQTLGTEWGRQTIDDGLWIDTTLDSIGSCTRIVIADVRFPNEVKAIRDKGGIVAKIVRPDFDNKLDSNHISETLINSLECDITFRNDRSLNDFREMILEWAERAWRISA